MTFIFTGDEVADKKVTRQTCWFRNENISNDSEETDTEMDLKLFPLQVRMCGNSYFQGVGTTVKVNPFSELNAEKTEAFIGICVSSQGALHLCTCASFPWTDEANKLTLAVLLFLFFVQSSLSFFSSCPFHLKSPDHCKSGSNAYTRKVTGISDFPELKRELTPFFLCLDCDCAGLETLFFRRGWF